MGGSVAGRIHIRSKQGTKLPKSIVVTTVKVGKTQGWLTSDERRRDMIKKDCTKSRCSYGFKSLRFEARESEDR